MGLQRVRHDGAPFTSAYTAGPCGYLFLCGGVYLLIANPHSIPPSLSPLISISLFSVSVGLFMFCT